MGVCMPAGVSTRTRSQPFFIYSALFLFRYDIIFIILFHEASLLVYDPITYKLPNENPLITFLYTPKYKISFLKAYYKNE